MSSKKCQTKIFNRDKYSKSSLSFAFCIFIIFHITSAKISLSKHVTEVNPNYRPFDGGRDIDGENLYVCRVFRFGQIVPGKFSNSLKKCSITHNNRESQFYRFELLVRNKNTKYDWVPVKAPVKKLPENAVFGGNRFATQLMMQKNNKTNKHTPDTFRLFPNNRTGMLLLRGDEINPDFWNHFLTQDLDWSLRKRRLKRTTTPTVRRRVRPLNTRKRFRKLLPSEVIGERRIMISHNKVQINMINTTAPVECPPVGDPESSKHHILIKPHSIECMKEPDPQKLNYYIAKCTLRTGNITSEQIGKIRWMESDNQWLASFPFGGHEIFCLDFSVLALKE